MMPKRMVDTVNPEIKKHHSAQDLYLTLNGIIRSLLIFYILVNSSQTLHNKILESIFRASVLFFNSNPIGKSDTKFLSEYV